MNGNDLLSHPMMLAHQRRLLAEARQLHLAAAARAATRAAAKAVATDEGSLPVARPVGAPPARGGRRPAVVGRAAGATSERRRPGLAGRLGATLVALGTRLEALDRSRRTG